MSSAAAMLLVVAALVVVAAMIIVAAALAQRPGQAWRAQWKRDVKELRAERSKYLVGEPVQPRTVPLEELFYAPFTHSYQRPIQSRDTVIGAAQLMAVPPAPEVVVIPDPPVMVTLPNGTFYYEGDDTAAVQFGSSSPGGPSTEGDPDVVTDALAAAWASSKSAGHSAWGWTKTKVLAAVESGKKALAKPSDADDSEADDQVVPLPVDSESLEDQPAEAPTSIRAGLGNWVGGLSYLGGQKPLEEWRSHLPLISELDLDSVEPGDEDLGVPPHITPSRKQS